MVPIAARTPMRSDFVVVAADGVGFRVDTELNGSLF
jgi:hypothetical protein